MFYYYTLNNSCPNYDTYESEVDGKLTLELPLAGYKKENIKIKMKKDELIIDVKGDEKKKITSSDIHKVYNIKGFYVKSATFIDGLLTITLEKNQEDETEIEIT